MQMFQQQLQGGAMTQQARGEKALNADQGHASAPQSASGSGNARYAGIVWRGTKRVSVREKQADRFITFQGQKGMQVLHDYDEVDAMGSKVTRPSPKSFREGIERSLESRVAEIFRSALERMSPDQLQRAVAAPTAAGTVVEVLTASPDVGLQKETAMTRALARGAVAKQEMIEEAGGCLSSGEVAKLLRITQSGVNLRRSRNSILAVPLSGGEWGFPARQFQDGELRPGLADVLRAAGAINPWVLLSILLDPVVGSEDTVLLDALDRPEVRGDILTRIATYGEQGGS
jgi:hypothetical protein